MIDNVSLAVFRSALDANDPESIFIDVRSPEEYEAEHIEGVINMPINTVENHVDELRAKDAVYVHCQRGGRAGRTCALLEEFGLTNVRKFTGGMDEWRNAGLPTVEGA